MEENKTLCGNPEHNANDGKDHAPADCGTEGHFNCDGKDHSHEK